MHDQIAETVREFLGEVGVKRFLYDTNNLRRTTQLKAKLAELGHSLGFRVAAGGCQADDGEWLYDMVWYQNSADGMFAQQSAVLEFEWGTSATLRRVTEVDPDFCKLVQARADIRVWVGIAHTPDLARVHLDSCRKQIYAFSGTMPGDRYLFVILIWWDKTLSDSTCMIEHLCV